MPLPFRKERGVEPGSWEVFTVGHFPWLCAQESPGPITLDGSYRVIVPKTLRVNPGTVIRIKIDRPIDLVFL